MERMAARVYCAVLLCLAGCWSTTGLNTVTPGVCPSKKYEAANCALIRFEPCTDDSDCSAYNLKCCSNGCGLQCLAPVTVKPGVCPKTNAELVRCSEKDLELCADDSECPKNQKCCRTACGGTRLKPGVCPSKKYGAEECTWIKFTSCADDSECADNEKCCNNGCGLQCMAPVTAKPGVCPKTNSDIRCIRKDDELCVGDSECPKNQKCCGTACGGTRCTAPVTVKPGVCPKTKSELVKCIIKGKELCADDSECPKNQKCCGTACGGTQCTAPVTVKPGVCPKTNAELVRCKRKDDKLCADDSECPKNQKCCGTPCGGTRCTAPVTGLTFVRF